MRPTRRSAEEGRGSEEAWEGGERSRLVPPGRSGAGLRRPPPLLRAIARPHVPRRDRIPQPTRDPAPRTAMPHEETLDPQDWTELRALAHRAVDDAVDYMASLRERPAWEHAPARGQGPLRRAAAAGPAARRRDLRRVPRVRAPLPARQQPPAVLGLGAGQRHADGGDRRDAGGVHRLGERHLLVRRQQLRRAAGAGLVQGAARLPARGRRAAHERLLRLEPDRAGGGAQRRGRVRRARPRGSRAARAAHRLLLGGGALVAHQGRRAAGHGHERAAPRAHRRPHAHRPRRARRHGRGATAPPACAPSASSASPAPPTPARSTTCPAWPTSAPREDLWFHVDGAFGAWAAIAPAVAPPRRRHGARRLAGLRPAQVDEPDLPGRLRAGPRRRGPAADLLADAVVPRARRGRPRPHGGGRALALGLRVRALARLPRAQGVDGAQGARHATSSRA